MCTMVILRRPAHSWPVLVAANRDERSDRPWKAPARHWPDRPEVVGGIDELAGGSWLALNDTGVLAAILNRRGSLGPEAGKRSRGELVLEALDHPDAHDAVGAMSDLNGLAYRPFNMVIADNRDAYWLRHAGESAEVEIRPLPLGLSMLTAGDLNETSPRIRRYLPRFRDAAVPDPEAGDWNAWEALLAAREHDESDPRAAMAIVTDGPFGTVSSSLIALPALERHRKPIWRFCPAIPGAAPFGDVALGK
ncbi:MAG TPA: NRDE family protein [Alphaproteobacteria bacterium]|nr:NRDE family protein [Alphaproteobacteria bacterium]